MKHLKKWFESYFETLWYDLVSSSASRSWGLFVVFNFLRGCSAVYKMLFSLHKALQLRFAEVPHSKIPVIVVGNLTVGGTGKTPLVIALAEYLKQGGYRPGIVSRGYGGRTAVYPLQVTAETSPLEAGDEAVLLAYRTQCPVVVAPKRVGAIHFLESQTDCNIVLSDDGLQHSSMKRDIEIIVIDGKRRFGNGQCLPAGPLREPISRCKTVDFLVTNDTNGKKIPPAPPFEKGGNKEVPFEKGEDKEVFFEKREDKEVFFEKGRNNEVLFSKGGIREYTFQVLPECFVHIGTEECYPLDFFQQQKVHVVTAIGHADRFLESLKNLQIDFDARVMPDHHVFVEKDLVFEQDTLKNRPIIMTEKDAVKCAKLGDLSESPLYYLRVIPELDASFKEAFMKKLNQVVLGLAGVGKSV